MGNAARAAGVDVRIGYGIGAAHGRRAVDGVHLVRLDGEKNAIAGSGPKIECDAVASSGGLSPTVHLYCHDGGRPQWDDARLAFVAPATGRAKAGIYCVGAVTGEFRLEQALAETHQTIAALLATFDKKDTLAGIDIHTGEPRDSRFPAHLPCFRRKARGARQEGLRRFPERRRGFRHPSRRARELSLDRATIKRYTALGFGTDQGKLERQRLRHRRRRAGVSIPAVGTTTYRPAYTPVTFGTLAGAHEATRSEPRRTTAMHALRRARGQVRAGGPVAAAWYFPKDGEDMHAAVRRECTAARRSVAILDASTLGKIDVRGKDVRVFLELRLCQCLGAARAWQRRYGLMLDENGMVMDDGVTACIADDHFHMTTTTGGAARVLTWLEKWHQTEWPRSRRLHDVGH